MFDPYFAVGAFVCARCLDGAVAAATSVASFAAAAAEVFGEEGGDRGRQALDHSPHCGHFGGGGLCLRGGRCRALRQFRRKCDCCLAVERRFQLEDAALFMDVPVLQRRSILNYCGVFRVGGRRRGSSE